MDKNAIVSVIERYKKQLGKMGLGVEKIILFGSWARGEGKAWSDIDLIVISRGFADKDLRERLELLGVAAARILEPIEAFGVTPQEWEHDEWPFLKEVTKGRVIHI